MTSFIYELLILFTNNWTFSAHIYPSPPPRAVTLRYHSTNDLHLIVYKKFCVLTHLCVCVFLRAGAPYDAAAHGEL